MNEICNETVSAVTKRKEGTRRRGRIYGQSCEEPTLDPHMSQCVPDDVMEAMANLSPEKKYSLYMDIFKPLDFYELLFERRFKQNELCQPETETTAFNPSK